MLGVVVSQQMKSHRLKNIDLIVFLINALELSNFQIGFLTSFNVNVSEGLKSQAILCLLEINGKKEKLNQHKWPLNPTVSQIE